MSKAILVMGMPDCCGRCPLAGDELSGSYCIAHDEDYIDIPDTMGGKPDWCPLRELPERKEYEHLKDGNGLKAWGNGWNACLDAIGGSRAIEREY